MMLMDFEQYESEDNSLHSFNSGNTHHDNNSEEQLKSKNDDTEFSESGLKLTSQSFVVKPHPATAKPIKCDQKSKKNFIPCEQSDDKIYHVNYDTILKLKESTKKLLCVLEEIQSKTHSKHLYEYDTPNLTQFLQPSVQTDQQSSTTDSISLNALKKLELQARNLDSINLQEEEEDDCSVYKKITRKCHCLNQGEYNDFVIHFNEDTKYRTSTVGEIIKNMRTLKKFLYMNGGYTKNALLFLNEGLADSTHTERVEIVQGCAHADMCNIFDEHSIVIMYISWPCKSDNFGDTVTQALTAGFLYKLAQLEEGRRYLNFSSRISNDIRKMIRKKSSILEFDTLESLNGTLHLLNPPLAPNINTTYHCKPIDEGMGKRTVETLAEYRQNMTLEEVFTNLDLLNYISRWDTGKMELLANLPALLTLFKRLLIDFDNSEMNIVITNILNSIVSKALVGTRSESPKRLVVADVGTEPILMKNETNQIPIRKPIKKGFNKSKIQCGNLGVSPNKFRADSRRKVAVTERENARSRSIVLERRSGPRRDLRSSLIIVPIDQKYK